MRTFFSGTLTTCGVIAALGLIAASAYMNWQFMFGLGKTGQEAVALGVAGLALDAGKSLLPLGIAAALANWRLGYAAIGSVAWVICAAVALMSAIGFVGLNRADAVGGRVAQNAQLQIAQRQFQATETRLSTIGQTQPVAVIEAEIRRLQQHRRWSSSKGCTNATIKVSQKFCAQFHEAEGRLAAAVEAARLRSQHAALTSELKTLRRAGAGQEADPQAGVIARWIPGIDVSNARDAMLVGLAVAFEFCAAFGLYLATRHGGVRHTVDPKSSDSVDLNHGNTADHKPQYSVHSNSTDLVPINAEPEIRGFAEVVPIRREQAEPLRLVLDDGARAWAKGQI